MANLEQPAKPEGVIASITQASAKVLEQGLGVGAKLDLGGLISIFTNVF